MKANILGIRPGLSVEQALKSLSLLGKPECLMLLPETHPVASPISKYSIFDTNGAELCYILVREGRTITVSGTELHTTMGILSLGDPVSKVCTVLQVRKDISPQGRDFMGGRLVEETETTDVIDFEIMFDDGILTHISLTEHIPLRPGAATSVLRE